MSPSQLQQIKTGHPSDRYWRLPNYTLANPVSRIREHLKNHNYPHTVPTTALEPLLQALASSLTVYETLPVATLRLFAHDRHLPLPNLRTATRKTLSRALRLADLSPTFHPFLRLPPEVRTLIYTFYCAPFAHEPLTLPTYPPLARVSTLLRTEVLPIFYAECTFAVALATDGQGREYRQNYRVMRPGPPPIPPVLRTQRETTLFFASLTPAHLAWIRSLEVTFDSYSSRGRVETFAMRVVLPKRGKVGNGTGSVQVVVGKDLEDDDRADSGIGITHPWKRGDVMAEELRELERRVEQEFVGEFQERGTGLVVGDVYRLRAMLEEFFE